MYKHLTSKQRDVLTQCLLLANYQEKEWEWGKKVYQCKPGQFIASIETIKEYCAKEVTTQNIRTALLKLEKWGFLTNKSTKTGRLITIIKWEVYQNSEIISNKDTNKQLTKSQQTANKELTTTNNIKKNKKEKKEDIYCSEQSLIVTEKSEQNNKFENYEWGNDVRKILSRYSTLKLVNADSEKNIKFWDGQIEIMSDYFPTDEEMQRWFNRTMFNIDRWQLDKPHRASKTAKGLRQRITTWLEKEYRKLETSKR